MIEEVPELFRFTQGILSEANIMLSFDISGSMDEWVDPEETITRLDIAKQALRDTLDSIGSLSESVSYPINVRICAWSGSSQTITRNSIGPEDIQDLKDWVDARSVIWAGTNFAAGLLPGLGFFPKDRPAQNLLFFITDGEPEPLSSLSDALSSCGEMINASTGPRNHQQGTAVSIYGINIALANTFYTAQIDNTPGDGVPVIVDGDASGLTQAITRMIVPFRQSIWTFTSADRDLTYNGETYKAIPIGRSSPESSDDSMRADLSIQIGRDCDLAQEFLKYVGDAITTVTVFQIEPSGVSVFWRGRVSSDKMDGDEMSLECESVFTSLRRPGLRARYQRNCRHTLYGSGCGLDKESFRVDAVYTSLVDRTIVVPDAASYAAGYFTGGMVRAPDGSARYVLSHAGDTLTLSRRLERLEEDGEPGVTQIGLYPGCARTRDHCINRFNNLDNYGGFPWIPGKNPFGGSSIV